MEWTASARAELDRRLEGAGGLLDGEVGDALKVADDIRHHVEAELEASGTTVVTVEEVDRLLRRMGVPETPPPERSPKNYDMITRIIRCWPTSMKASA